MKNTLTFNQADAIALRAAGLTDNDIHVSLRQVYLNNKAMKIYRLLDGLNDPWYNMVTPLTGVADQERLKDVTNNGGTISAIDATAETITRTTGQFFEGSVIAVTIWSGISTIVAQFFARILEDGTTVPYEMISGTDANLSTHACSVLVFRTANGQVADISSLYVKNIIKIFDNQGDAEFNERVLDEVLDPKYFGDLAQDPFMVDRAAYYWRGNIIEFFVGESANVLGTLQMLYRGKVNVWTDATANSAILLPPEENQMLIDELTDSYLQHAQKARPEDLAARIQTYNQRYTAASAEAAKADLEKGK